MAKKPLPPTPTPSPSPGIDPESKSVVKDEVAAPTVAVVTEQDPPSPPPSPPKKKKQGIPGQLRALNKKRTILSREMERQAVAMRVAHVSMDEIATRIGIRVRSVQRLLKRAESRPVEGTESLKRILKWELEKRLRVIDSVEAASRMDLIDASKACEECRARAPRVRLPQLKALAVAEHARSRIDVTRRAVDGLDAPIRIEPVVEEKLRDFLGKIAGALDRETYEKVLSVYLDARAGEAGADEAPGRGGAPN